MANIPPKRRTPDAKWVLMGVYPEYTAYQKGGIWALSSVAFLEDERLPPHWEWLISFSYMGVRSLSDEEIKVCRKEWNMDNFEEDNHEKGIARKFWLAVEEKYRVPCPCKDEIVITDGDYKYSQKKDANQSN